MSNDPRDESRNGEGDPSRRQFLTGAGVLSAGAFLAACGVKVTSTGQPTGLLAGQPTPTSDLAMPPLSGDLAATVFLPLPIADFAATPTHGCSPLPVQFMAVTDSTVTAWQWSFGDGTTSTEQNPLHTYATPGTYTVSLVATASCTSAPMVREQYIHQAHTLIEFGEENDAWVQRVSEPILCYYQPLETLNTVGVVLYTPRTNPCK